MLVAGVVSDEVCEQVKGVRPFVPLEERLAIVDAIGIVDATYAELTTDKLDAWREVGFHRVFKGDDWRDTARGLELEAKVGGVGVEVVYFPYTAHTSSTAAPARDRRLVSEAVHRRPHRLGLRRRAAAARGSGRARRW